MNTKVAKKNNKGFTLIELIVVIAIIAVLAAILAPQYLRYVEKSRISTDCQTAAEILNAARTACAEEDVYDNLNDADNKVTWDEEDHITVSGTKDKTPNEGKLAVEVRTTIGGDAAATTTIPRKSKTLDKKGVWEVTITPKTSNGTITVNGEWKKGTSSISDTDLEEFTKKSGGKVTKTK